MIYALCVLAGLLIGGLVAWLIATARITKSLPTKVEEADRRTNMAEGRASGLEATVTELRLQNRKRFRNDSFGYSCYGDWRS